MLLLLLYAVSRPQEGEMFSHAIAQAIALSVEPPENIDMTVGAELITAVPKPRRRAARPKTQKR